MKDIFKGTKVYVTGGRGLIGIPREEMLLVRGARVRLISLDYGIRSLTMGIGA